MDDWTFAYILVGILIPLCYIACASYGIYKQRRAAAHAVAVQKRQEGLYETYWYSWKQSGDDIPSTNNRSTTNDSGIRGLFGARELADMSQRRLERNVVQIPVHATNTTNTASMANMVNTANMTVRDAGEGSSRDLTHDYHTNQEAVHNSIYWNAV